MRFLLIVISSFMLFSCNDSIVDGDGNNSGSESTSEMNFFRERIQSEPLELRTELINELKSLYDNEREERTVTYQGNMDSLVFSWDINSEDIKGAFVPLYNLQHAFYEVNESESSIYLHLPNKFSWGSLDQKGHFRRADKDSDAIYILIRDYKAYEAVNILRKLGELCADPSIYIADKWGQSIINFYLTRGVSYNTTIDRFQHIQEFQLDGFGKNINCVLKNNPKATKLPYYELYEIDWDDLNLDEVRAIGSDIVFVGKQGSVHHKVSRNRELETDEHINSFKISLNTSDEAMFFANVIKQYINKYKL
jgi:hypothetical protein